MEVQEVKDRVSRIKEVLPDEGLAHIMEDDLYQAVLEAIAENPIAAQELARAALESKKLEYGRYVS